ncbi:hypothetical protein EYF80_019701 [Liparis tanakae]|uniref:Uncharacterized protein n=1 Tax=Liparis tanakae TaxID=230148 RepID=A0A4Z2HXG1_9TELE|nr:hypothetical protein EYF80_019701 [Liparis tanakae]
MSTSVQYGHQRQRWKDAEESTSGLRIQSSVFAKPLAVLALMGIRPVTTTERALHSSHNNSTEFTVVPHLKIPRAGTPPGRDGRCHSSGGGHVDQTSSSKDMEVKVTMFRSKWLK